MSDRRYFIRGIILVVLWFTFTFGCTYAVRQHGISSCKDRGGSPIVHSWLSESNWDVSCLGA